MLVVRSGDGLRTRAAACSFVQTPSVLMGSGAEQVELDEPMGTQDFDLVACHARDRLRYERIACGTTSMHGVPVGNCGFHDEMRATGHVSEPYHEATQQ